MRNNTVANLFVIAILLFGSLSCKKYLDKKSNNSLVVPSTLEDAQALLDDANHMNK